MTQQRTRSVRQRGSRKYCLEQKQWTFCTIQRCKKDIHIHILFPSSDISIQESTCIRAVRVYSFRLWEAQTLSYEVMCRTFRTTFWRARSARLAGPWDSVPLMVTPFSGVTNRAFCKNPKNASCTVVASAKRISAASRHHIIHYMLPNVKNKREKYSRYLVEADVNMYLYFRFVGASCHACYTNQVQCHQVCVSTGDTRDTS